MAAVGLVVGDSGVLTAGDTALQSLLTGAGHTVTVVDDATNPDGSQDCYVLAESCAVSVGSNYTALASPVVSLDIGSWDDMLLSAVNADNSATSNRFYDLDTHEITTGITPAADCQVRTANAGMYGIPGGAGNLAPGAVIFARHGSSATHTTGFVVDQGGALTTGTAAARRVCLGYIENWPANLTTNGQTLFLQAVDWALAGGVAPAEGSASGSVTWTGLATGQTSHSGSASGSTMWAGSATSSTTHEGSATGSIAWTGAAAGTRPSQGHTNGGMLAGGSEWTGVATGATAHQGDAASSVTWSGTATGEAPSSFAPAAIVTGTVTGPAQVEETVTGPELARVSTGPALARAVTGPAFGADDTTGPAVVTDPTPTGPALRRVVTGPGLSRTLTGAGR